MPLTGNVSSFSTLFQCPVASKFEDAFFGLYGNGSYLTTYSSPWDTPPNYLNTPCYYYGSTLQFGCVNCPVGTYSMSRGHSDGSPGSADNLTCLACPFGGHCENGTLCATPGYWGSGSPTVSFTLCPSGYCCDEFPCSAIDACTGHREGMLCGDCEQGYQPAVGSVACVRESQCKHDSAIFWPLFVLGCFLGSLLLLLASSVAFGPKGNNSVRIKVIVYFYQVSVVS